VKELAGVENVLLAQHNPAVGRNKRPLNAQAIDFRAVGRVEVFE
jgi:hypothetical protein